MINPKQSCPRNCPNRSSECHSECNTYNTYRKALDDYNANKRKQIEGMSFKHFDRVSIY